MESATDKTVGGWEGGASGGGQRMLGGGRGGAGNISSPICQVERDVTRESVWRVCVCSTGSHDLVTERNLRLFKRFQNCI